MAARKSKKRKTSARERPIRTRKIRPGFISHTELASDDPSATKAWCETVLGWKFGDSMPTPTGPYHPWSFGDSTGGGIRATTNLPPQGKDGVPFVDRPEAPGSTPYCEVPDIKSAYERALKAGAKEMFPPNKIPGGNGWIAIVRAPGGVAIGLWAPK
jgi:predicted enzyme related to lactoylglutathione lyase